MKLKILGHEYDIQLDGKLDLDDRTVAQINTSSLWIKISPLYPKSKQEEGLMHEILEAINYHLELKFEHPVISSLSEGIYQVLKDNELIDFSKILKKE